MSEPTDAADAAAAAAYSPEQRTLARDLMTEHYDTLLQVARSKRRRARLGETLATVDLLHESLLRFDGAREWSSSEHFVRAVVLAMRCVIVDYARRRTAAKRGGGARHVGYDEAEPFLPEFSETPEELVAIAELLAKLGEVNARWLEVVDARYFGGMTEDEAAGALGRSSRTVRRDWSAARAWLAEQLGVPGG